MAQRRKIEVVVGCVSRELVDQGTGSEREAVVLRTDSGERVILQRAGGNPFDDAQTRELTGREVRLEGYRLGSVFRFTSVVPKLGP